MENSICIQPSAFFPHSLGSQGRAAPPLAAAKAYEIRLSNGTDLLRTKADQLVERMYRARGLLHDSTTISIGPLDEQHKITVAACKAHNVVATVTLSLDADTGLLADTLYRDLIDRKRRKGARVCEITRLAIDSGHESREMLISMLQCLYVLGRLIHRITDVFIEVHPRHSGFYARKLGYQQVGPERICPRVGAPAVLMHLCEHELEHMLDTQAGMSRSRLNNSISSSLYHQFEARSELERMGEHIRELLCKSGQLKTSA